MYQYIKGHIEEIEENYFVLENQGIGYRIFTSQNALLKAARQKESQKVYTYLHVREDDLSLYGFLEREELEVFKLLLSVSKIGPKVGLGILSTMTPADVKRAIYGDDEVALSKAPGVGKKTAKRMILELKDKIGDDFLMEDTDVQVVSRKNIDEAMGALMALGYNVSEANAVLSKVQVDHLTTEEIIKVALKEIGK